MAEHTDELLPCLFNSSSRRKKDINSLFPHLSNQVYRCREYPHGIYINEFGELCPTDQRTGIFNLALSPIKRNNKRKPVDVKEENELEPEDLDNDEATDSEDEYWSKEEERSKKRQKQEEDDDDDYEEEEDNDHEENSEEEDDDDENLTHGKVEEEEEEQKQEAEQQETIRQINHTIELEQKNRKERIKRQKILKFLEEFIDEWTIKIRRMKKLREPVIKMETNPKLYQTCPQCDFQFTGRGYRTMEAKLNMENEDNLAIQCQCGQEFFTVQTLYEHIALH